ncbi:MAG: N-acetylneuraminate synthase family protein, partial [Rhodospirillaceae bacterium]
MKPESAVATTFVIAEIGVNHNGDLALARSLIDAAAAAGADAVKFQSFTADQLVTARTPKAKYQARNTGGANTQLDMLRALELSERDQAALYDACARACVEFMSTPFDENAVRFLVRDLRVKRLKVASGEITNAPLLLEITRAGTPIILSTGMTSLDEVETALGIIAFGS